MTGAFSKWLRFAEMHGCYRCRRRDPQLPAPKAVSAVPLLVVLKMLFCSGDIETNPGPRVEPHPKLKSLHTLLEKAVRLLEQVFGGSTKEGYLSTALILAGTEVTETMMYLNAEFRELGLEEGEKKLQTEFLASISNSVEVLHLFYKIPRAFFLGESCNTRLQRFFSRLHLFPTIAGKEVEFPSFWLDCYLYTLAIIGDWADNSVSVCRQLVLSGLLYVNINFIKKVGCSDMFGNEVKYRDGLPTFARVCNRERRRVSNSQYSSLQ